MDRLLQSFADAMVSPTTEPRITEILTSLNGVTEEDIVLDLLESLRSMTAHDITPLRHHPETVPTLLSLSTESLTEERRSLLSYFLDRLGPHHMLEECRRCPKDLLELVKLVVHVADANHLTMLCSILSALSLDPETKMLLCELMPLMKPLFRRCGSFPYTFDRMLVLRIAMEVTVDEKCATEFWNVGGYACLHHVVMDVVSAVEEQQHRNVEQGSWCILDVLTHLFEIAWNETERNLSLLQTEPRSLLLMALGYAIPRGNLDSLRKCFWSETIQQHFPQFAFQALCARVALECSRMESWALCEMMNQAYAMTYYMEDVRETMPSFFLNYRRA